MKVLLVKQSHLSLNQNAAGLMRDVFRNQDGSVELLSSPKQGVLKNTLSSHQKLNDHCDGESFLL